MPPSLNRAASSIKLSLGRRYTDFKELVNRLSLRLDNAIAQIA